MNKQIQKIKTNIKKGQYNLKRIVEKERNLSRIKRIKKLIQKIKKSKRELIEDRMLLFFELGKELDDKYTVRPLYSYIISFTKIGNYIKV